MFQNQQMMQVESSEQEGEDSQDYRQEIEMSSASQIHLPS